MIPDPRFERAATLMLGHEGGYVNDPADPGGETKFGISKRAYPDLDIAGLTLADVLPIYHRDYWRAAGCDLLPPGLAYAVFDAAVNCGVGRAKRWLQEALGTVADGRIGPVTRAAIAAIGDPGAVIRDFHAERLLHYMQLDALNDRYGRGWGRRVLDLDRAALRFAASAD